MISGIAGARPLGTVVRELALTQAGVTPAREKTIPAKPVTAEAALLRRELNRIGVNLNSAVRALNSLARGTTRRNRALLERLTALETATAAVRELVVARMVNR